MTDSNLNENEKEEKLNKTETIKKPLITFAKLNKYYIILFISPIFCMLSNYISDKIGKVSNVSNESNVLNVSNVSNVSNENYFYIVINSELFYIFAGLFYFVSFFKKNSNKGRELEKLEKVSFSDKDIDYIYIMLQLLIIPKKF